MLYYGLAGLAGVTMTLLRPIVAKPQMVGSEVLLVSNNAQLQDSVYYKMVGYQPNTIHNPTVII